MRIVTPVAACIALAVQCAAAQAQQPSAAASTIAIIPQPTSVTPRAGRFQLTPRTVIWTDQAGVSIGRQLARYLEPATGFTLRVQTAGAAPAGAILLRRDPALTRLGTEGYALDVRAGGVVARAPQLAGSLLRRSDNAAAPAARDFREAPSEDVEWSMTLIDPDGNPILVDQHVDSPQNLKNKMARKE